ncbi:hypothetical protein JIG36_33070 [Actinoplanes sp. LDG1-06]|uniref:Uncharacterized protein n=1 Tax=Paractinoplanes ovalisporus TaxID=2810368 RepID=A0ABS2AKH6_9ACTN|nr:hypothetical protein [Actinoplanes ovalisporus]MBM2620354.1 hypothetical protein [Actinoplanes ovalisporus]
MSIDDPMFDGLVGVRMSFDVSRQSAPAGAVIRLWFESAWAELGGVLKERVAAGVPDDISVMATTGLEGADLDDMFFEDDMTRWPEYLDRLSAGTYVGAMFRVTASEGGSPLPYYRTDDRVVCFMYRTGDVVQLIVESKEKFWYADPAREAAVAAFLGRMVRSCDVDYAEASFAYGSIMTCVEEYTGQFWATAAGTARRQLRGYAWLTVVPSSLVPQVGGAAGLRSSGAFWAVEELPGGAVLLRATEHFGDYRDAEAARVLDVLRPVLPSDTPASAFRRKVDIWRRRAV